MEFLTLTQAIGAACAIAYDRAGIHEESIMRVSSGDGAHVTLDAPSMIVDVSIAGAACNEEEAYYTIGEIVTLAIPRSMRTVSADEMIARNYAARHADS